MLFARIALGIKSEELTRREVQDRISTGRRLPHIERMSPRPTLLFFASWISLAACGDRVEVVDAESSASLIACMATTPCTGDNDPQCRCRPCDEYRLQCGLQGSGNVVGEMTSEECNLRIICTIKISAWACTHFGLQSGSIDPAALQSHVQNFSNPNYLNAYATACMIVHEADHALHNCDDTCATETSARVAELACYNRAYSMGCTAQNPDTDRDWQTQNTCGNRTEYVYVQGGELCANIKYWAAEKSYERSWFAARCSSGQPLNCANEPTRVSQHNYCFYRPHQVDPIAIAYLTGEPEVDETCRVAESAYGAQIDADRQPGGAFH